MIAFIGLGNRNEYAKTKHNADWSIDEFAIRNKLSFKLAMELSFRIKRAGGISFQLPKNKAEL